MIGMVDLVAENLSEAYNARPKANRDQWLLTSFLHEHLAPLFV